MSALLLVGDRLEFEIYDFRNALKDKNYEAVYALAQKQIEAGCTYLNLSVGSYDEDKTTMAHLVQVLQERFENVPLFLSSYNPDVIEAGLRVYNRERDKPVVNSADAGSRVDYIELAAAYDSKVVCVCMKNKLPLNETERFDYCTSMLERGMELGIHPDDMFFDPVLVSIREDQERLVDVLKAIEQINKLGLNTIVGLTNVSMGVPEEAKVYIDSAFVNMALAKGLKAAILNPLNPIVMHSILAGEEILNQQIYTPATFTKALD